MSEIKFAKFDTAKDEQNNLEIRKNGLVFALWFGPNFGAITYDICNKNSPKITDAKTLYYEKIREKVLLENADEIAKDIAQNLSEFVLIHKI